MNVQINKRIVDKLSPAENNSIIRWVDIDMYYTPIGASHHILSLIIDKIFLLPQTFEGAVLEFILFKKDANDVWKPTNFAVRCPLDGVKFEAGKLYVISIYSNKRT